MKVRELVQKLSALDQNLDVLCWSEDEKLLGGKPGFLLLEIESVEVTTGERTRLADETPSFKIGGGAPIAVLQVTADF